MMDWSAVASSNSDRIKMTDRATVHECWQDAADETAIRMPSDEAVSGRSGVTWRSTVQSGQIFEDTTLLKYHRQIQPQHERAKPENYSKEQYYDEAWQYDEADDSDDDDGSDDDDRSSGYRVCENKEMGRDRRAIYLPSHVDGPLLDEDKMEIDFVAPHGTKKLCLPEGHLQTTGSGQLRFEKVPSVSHPPTPQTERGESLFISPPLPKQFVIRTGSGSLSVESSSPLMSPESASPATDRGEHHLVELNRRNEITVMAKPKAMKADVSPGMKDSDSSSSFAVFRKEASPSVEKESISQNQTYRSHPRRTRSKMPVVKAYVSHTREIIQATLVQPLSDEEEEGHGNVKGHQRLNDSNYSTSDKMVSGDDGRNVRCQAFDELQDSAVTGSDAGSSSDQMKTSFDQKEGEEDEQEEGNMKRLTDTPSSGFTVPGARAIKDVTEKRKKKEEEEEEEEEAAVLAAVVNESDLADMRLKRQVSIHPHKKRSKDNIMSNSAGAAAVSALHSPPSVISENNQFKSANMGDIRFQNGTGVSHHRSLDSSTALNSTRSEIEGREGRGKDMRRSKTASGTGLDKLKKKSQGAVRATDKAAAGSKVEPELPTAAAAAAMAASDPVAGSSQLSRFDVVLHRDQNGYGMTMAGTRPVVVSAVIRYGVAEKYGIQPGDEIFRINGTYVYDYDHNDVVQRIRNAGSFVSLTLQRLGLKETVSSAAESLATSSSSSSIYQLSAPTRGSSQQGISKPKASKKEKEPKEHTRSTRRVAYEKVEQKLAKSEHPTDENHRRMESQSHIVQNLEEVPSSSSSAASGDQAYSSLKKNIAKARGGGGGDSVGGEDLRGQGFGSITNVLSSTLPGERSMPSNILAASTPLFQLGPAKSKTGPGVRVPPKPATPAVSPAIGVDNDDLLSDEEAIPLPSTFQDLQVLKKSPAHLAVFLNFLISSSDPAPMLFSLIADYYYQSCSRETGFATRWAFEIYTAFLATGAPLKLSVNEGMVSSIESVLQSMKENELRTVFRPVENFVSENVLKKFLNDFQEKQRLGLGTMYGIQELKEKMDRISELKTVDSTLSNHFSSFLNDETESSAQCLAFSLATFFRQIGFVPAKNSFLFETCPSFICKDKRVLKYKLKKNYESKGHVFNPHQCTSITKCQNCDKLIWGIGFQAYQCSNCELVVHRRCAENVWQLCSASAQKMKGLLGVREMIKPIRKPSKEGGSVPSKSIFHIPSDEFFPAAHARKPAEDFRTKKKKVPTATLR